MLKIRKKIRVNACYRKRPALAGIHFLPITFSAWKQTNYVVVGNLYVK